MINANAATRFPADVDSVHVSRGDFKGRTGMIRLLTSLLFLFGSCSDTKPSAQTPPSEEANASAPPSDAHTFQSLGFSSDPFSFASTQSSQLAVFRALFDPETGYRVSGPQSSENLEAFFADVRKGYMLKDPDVDPHARREYHTFTHAMDVMVTTHAFLQAGAAVHLSDNEQAALILAALAHDVLHLGVKNSFLVQAKHPLADQFPHQNLQEKRSAEHCLALLDKHGILSPKEGDDNATRQALADARSLAEQVILWTDMSRHGDLMKETAGRATPLAAVLARAREAADSPEDNASRGATAADLAAGVRAIPRDRDTRIIFAAFLLHCADVSNPTKDWNQCERWTGLVMNEFFSQGDLEKELGLEVSMLCDRETVTIPKSQIGFGNFVIRDLFKLLRKIAFTAGDPALKQFEANQLNWKALAEADEPYLIDFRPPTREGGWTGERRPEE